MDDLTMTRPWRDATRADLEGEVVAVARRLLGARLTARGVSVRLTEVEAYAGHLDPGSHAYRGRTVRTEPMFRTAGHLYVYAIYGMHRCANLVTGAEGVASAVLLRAGEVLAGVDLARERSGTPRTPLPPHRLASGPARLGRVLGLGLSDTGADLLVPDPVLRVELGAPTPADLVRSGPRVGVSGPGGVAETFPWRFWIDGEPSVSPYRPGRTRAARDTRA